MAIQKKSWFEDEGFWELWRDQMFNARRLAGTAGEVDGIIKLLNLRTGAQILDLCCGQGRHAIELAKRGFRVTGVDRTQTYLNIARQQAEKDNLQIEFIRNDMRSFTRPEAFDGIISMFTSFGYFEDPADDSTVVTNMYRSLRDGGHLLIDVNGKEVLARIFRERDWREEDGVIRLEERKVTKDWSWMENRWILIKEGHVFENRLSLSLYSATELKTLLYGCGFKKVDAYGSLSGVPYDHEASRLVVVGTK